MTAADRLRALADAATEGPWRAEAKREDAPRIVSPWFSVCDVYGAKDAPRVEADAALIALAPVAVREWAACLDALAQIRDWNRAGIGNESDAVEAMDSALARAEQHTKEEA